MRIQFPAASGLTETGAMLAVSGVVSNLNPVSDPSDPAKEWKDKRKVPGLEVAFLGGTVRGVLAWPDKIPSLGVGQRVSVLCGCRLFQGSFNPQTLYVTAVDDKPTVFGAPAPLFDQQKQNQK